MTRSSRILSAGSLGRGIAEVALIFIGITLAIGFENWNSEREEREVERELLEEVRLNLVDNQIQLDTLLLAAIDVTLGMEALAATLEDDLPWDTRSRRALARLDNWPSPFFVTSAWETLRVRGLTLIEDPELRRELVTVYEGTYPFLVEDVDRYQWEMHAEVMYPLRAQHVREVIAETGEIFAEPIDDALLRADPRLAAAVRTKATNWRRVFELYRDSQMATSRMIDRLTDVLGSPASRPASVLERPDAKARIERFRLERPIARLVRDQQGGAQQR